MISDETRRRQSESHKGIKHTEEQNYKLSQAGKSQKNIEHLRRVSDSNCNKPRSEETKHKISLTLKGKVPWNKGVPQTEETIKKLSASAKTSPLSQKHMIALHEAQIGKERSIETREKQSNALRKDNSRKWFDGITKLYTQIRKHSKMVVWRNAVIKKDNYKDYYSGCIPSRENPLEAHHILPFWRILEKYNIKTLDDALNCDALWDVNNGITLLKSSHRAYHNMYGNDYE